MATFHEATCGTLGKVGSTIVALTSMAVNVAKAAELAYMVMRRHRQVYRQV